jgi:murein DD-endopeptidase MepM/ murein hydrolase activator NlpD
LNKFLNFFLFNCLSIGFIFPQQLISKSFLQEPDDPVYYVQSGDTLSYIAGLFGVTVDEIISRNNIDNANSLAVGTGLSIPGLDGITGTLDVTTIPLGENLDSLLIKNNISKETLVTLNHITIPSEIYSGSRLIIPTSDVTNELIPVHGIETGDTWLEMAIQQGNNPWKILDQNQKIHSWMFIPGEKVFAIKDNKTEGMEINPISPALENLTIDPLPLKQGSTVELVIETNVPLKLEGELAGSTLHFQPYGENKYVAFQGLSALQEPGLVNFSITGDSEEGRMIDFSQFILNEDVNFGELMLLTVAPETIDQASIEQDDKLIRQYTSVISPQKYWQGNFAYPVDEPWINARYGQERVYNGSYIYYHTGTDFGVNTSNLNIYAPAPGKVVYAGPTIIRGNYTLIDHGWGVFSGFAHQDQIQVQEGDFVETGQLIGQIGSTGRSTGPHLHWDLWVNGVLVNALDWIENNYP